MNMEHPVMLDRNCSKIYDGMSQRAYVTIMRVCHCSQIEVDPTSQIWEGLKNKIIKYSIEQKTTEKIGIHKSIPIINEQGRREASCL